MTYNAFEEDLYHLLVAVEDHPEFTTEAHAEFVASSLYADWRFVRREEDE